MKEIEELYLDYSRQEGEWVPNRYGPGGASVTVGRTGGARTCRVVVLSFERAALDDFLEAQVRARSSSDRFRAGMKRNRLPRGALIAT